MYPVSIVYMVKINYLLFSIKMYKYRISLNEKIE